MTRPSSRRRSAPFVLALAVALAPVLVSVFAGVAQAGLELCFVGVCCDGGTFRPSKFVCRPAAGACDVAETCTGTSSACPPDAVLPTRTLCRGASGGCDRAESCSGLSKDCPADGVRSAGSVCRAAAGVCDVAEECNGSTKICPSDSFAAQGVLCRAANENCDLVEVCTGTSATCPADVLEDEGVPCRKLQGICDVIESCSGSSPSCPPDGDRDGEPCHEGSPCFDDPGTCDGKICVGAIPVDCSDGNPCTQDVCDEGDGGNCIHPPDDDGISCDDGDVCTAGDECEDGICLGTPVLLCESTTTTMLEPGVCGDADDDGKVEASDALAALKGAVGIGKCPLVRCDYNGDDKLTAGDALLILRDAVGTPGSPKCPDIEPVAANDEAGHAGSTTSTTLAP